ncbi:hypothetical protein H9Y04_09855 [Streptomyces sp. TRM66268-LWL]|uniref:Lipoprotein n=1 Tax=Streptomyces polyasparticus TaxID=2767826 RepID=A0ABR7SBN1_9ACTN|nr:hypothetical protein [Streptomyces polyasparticus]MBC9712875.1 hypothetical protein [Streptomyces polyasparticus]
MRTVITRCTRLLLPLALLTALAGCGDSPPADSGVRHKPAPVPSGVPARAQEVADAWNGSRAAEQWRQGYFPMGPVIQVPAGGFHNAADERAYLTQNFGVRGELPVEMPKTGEARWPDGATLARPLITVRAAYESFAGTVNDDHRLIVTRVELGEMTLESQRGPVTVPAWLFGLKGYDTPLKRSALVPSKLPASPIAPLPRTGESELDQLDGVLDFSVDGRSMTARARHGACDDGPRVAVLEHGGTVVLSASVADATPGDLCTSQLLVESVQVKLERPLGDRVLLDAFTGLPVPYGEMHGWAKSWS